MIVLHSYCLTTYFYAWLPHLTCSTSELYVTSYLFLLLDTIEVVGINLYLFLVGILVTSHGSNMPQHKPQLV